MNMKYCLHNTNYLSYVANGLTITKQQQNYNDGSYQALPYNCSVNANFR